MKYRFNFPITARHAEEPRFCFDRREIERRANYEKLCTARHLYVKAIPFRKALISHYKLAVADCERDERIMGIIRSGVYDFIKNEENRNERYKLYWRERDKLRAAGLKAMREKDTALAESLSEHMEALHLVKRAAEGFKPPRAKLNDFGWIDRLGPLPEAFDEK